MATVSYPHVELIQNQWLITVFEGQRHTTYETISPASLPTQVITHPRLSEGRLGGSTASFKQNSVMQNHGSSRFENVDGGWFQFLAHDWDDLNPGIYAKGHFYQKSAPAGYIFELRQGRNPAYKRFHIHTCMIYFTGWFRMSDIKTKHCLSSCSHR